LSDSLAAFAMALPGWDRSGERHHVDTRVANQGGADVPVAGDHVEDSGSQDVRGELRQLQRGERGQLGGLEHNRAAGGERGADLPDGHHQRVVPRRDRRHDAHGVATQHRRVTVEVLAGGAPFQEAGGAGEEPEVVDGEADLLGHRGDGLADVERFEGAEVLGVRLDAVGQGEQGRAALRGRRRSPRGEGAAGGGDGGVHLVGRGARDLGDHGPGGGVDDRIGLGGLRAPELAADESRQRHIGTADRRHGCPLPARGYALRSWWGA
jgi:hypothetical protein